MSNRSLIATGAIGAALVTLCCATPLLTVVGGIGLAAWFAKADYMVIAALFLGVAVAGFGFYRRRVAASCCAGTAKNKGST